MEFDRSIYRAIQDIVLEGDNRSIKRRRRFNKESHGEFLGIKKNKYLLCHLEGNRNVFLSEIYILKLCKMISLFLNTPKEPHAISLFEYFIFAKSNDCQMFCDSDINQVNHLPPPPLLPLYCAV